MALVKPVRTEEEYEAALTRIDELMDADHGSPEGEELDVLVDLVEYYESKHVPLGYPDPLAAIEFRMEQAGLSPRDLVPLMGSRAKVSEVLSGKRSITMAMARALHEHLGIPAEVLLRESSGASSNPLSKIEWTRFPLEAMAKRSWIPSGPNLKEQAESLMRDLIDRAGGQDIVGVALYRKNDHKRANAKMDPYALEAWCWQVLATANKEMPERDYKRDTVTLDFLRQIAQLSWFEKGPWLAKEFLSKHGIPLVTVQHLPKTYLDGAALRMKDGRPVIGLTLRYDRIDNFWFCLLHELAHVGLHMNDGGSEAFVDDLNLRRTERGRPSHEESQADNWAEEAPIPKVVWDASSVRNQPTPMAVMNLANALRVHPAIVAGRVRHERQNYRLLSQFVGTGSIRRQFGQPPA